MRLGLSLLLALCFGLPLRAQSSQPPSQPAASPAATPHLVAKLPRNTILIKGAWWSASDSTTPLPETGTIQGSTFSNPYFGISWTLPAEWYQQYEGPPPSDGGRYVLAQFVPAKSWSKPARGSILITAEDLFFTPLPASNLHQIVDLQWHSLASTFKVEAPPTDATLAGRPFRVFSYWAPASELHWLVLATEIRCHVVEFVITGTDPNLLDDLRRQMNSIVFAPELPSTSSSAPPKCLRNYARDENLVTRVEPAFGQSRYNPMPVRIVIGEDGRIKHIHILSAFPDQSRAISDALAQWKFKPYLRDGHPAEVETGILFGRSSVPSGQGAAAPAAR